MDPLAPEVNRSRHALDAILAKLNINAQRTELATLKTASEASDFWQDSTAAQQHMQSIAKLEARIDPWLVLDTELTEIAELLALDDPELAADLAGQYQTWLAKYEAAQHLLRFSGPYDDSDVILGIHAGAGGTDAQDWAEMLLRMYIRYCEKNKWKCSIIDESAGEEAGIKSATLQIEGSLTYGKLKGEHGVHRLVRLSPFNSDNLRQTSFAKVEIMPKIDTPERLTIDEKDLKIDVYRAGGHGGQSVNTTDSAVRITHLPTGITVAIQNERSQLQNKEMAMTIIRSRLAQLQIEQHKEQLSELKGPNQSAEWGNQIRSYVLHPYKQVKDLRSKYETSDPAAVLDGELDALIDAYLASV